MSGDSGGDEGMSPDARKGKRELSTSKRAAQNRAAQVHYPKAMLSLNIADHHTARFQTTKRGLYQEAGRTSQRVPSDGIKLPRSPERELPATRVHTEPPVKAP